MTLCTNLNLKFILLLKYLMNFDQWDLMPPTIYCRWSFTTAFHIGLNIEHIMIYFVKPTVCCENLRWWHYISDYVPCSSAYTADQWILYLMWHCWLSPTVCCYGCYFTSWIMYLVPLRWSLYLLSSRTVITGCLSPRQELNTTPPLWFCDYIDICSWSSAPKHNRRPKKVIRNCLQ